MKGGPLLNLMPLLPYLEKLSKLSKGELQVTHANIKLITSVSHVRKLKRSKITSCKLLFEIINYKISEVLQKKELEEADNYATMQSVLENVINKCSDDKVWEAPDTKPKAITCTYYHLPFHNPDVDNKD